MLNTYFWTFACEQIPLNDVIPIFWSQRPGEVVAVSTNEKIPGKKSAHLLIVSEWILQLYIYVSVTLYLHFHVVNPNYAIRRPRSQVCSVPSAMTMLPIASATGFECIERTLLFWHARISLFILFASVWSIRKREQLAWLYNYNGWEPHVIPTTVTRRAHVAARTAAVLMVISTESCLSVMAGPPPPTINCRCLHSGIFQSMSSSYFVHMTHVGVHKVTESSRLWWWLQCQFITSVSLVDIDDEIIWVP